MKKSPTDSVAYDAFINKLASSCLTAKDAEQLGIEFISESEASKKLAKNIDPSVGLLIRYFDPDGVQRAFYRFRYIESVKKASTGFSSLVEKKPRYTQPLGDPPQAYFPLIGAVDWMDVIVNTNTPVALTEGELKAAAATKYGIPTIGLGGVFNWKSTKDGVDLIQDLRDIEWSKRVVYIIFDSDFKTKPQVCIALDQISAKLVKLGAKPYVVSLRDSIDGQKQGIDDALLAHAEDDREVFIDSLLEAAQPVGSAMHLWRFNNEVVYIRKTGIIVRQEDGEHISPAAFVSHAYSNRLYNEVVTDSKGNKKLVERSLPEQWLKWPQRYELSKMVYSPGKERVFNNQWNTWNGWGVEPWPEPVKRSDVLPWLELIDRICEGLEPEAKEWFQRWLAYPLQYPGAKLYSSVLVHGRNQGTGKSMIGYTMKAIYGENFTEVNQKDLDGQYTDFMNKKQFVLADDINGTVDKPGQHDMIKKLITQKEARINIKYVPAYEVQDVLNWYWTSNRPAAFFLEDKDRRFFIHEVVSEPLDELFKAVYDGWLLGDGDNEGARKLFRWMLDLDLGSFSPTADAMMTAAKERMIYTVKSDLAGWVRTLLEDPGSMFESIGMTDPGVDMFNHGDLLLMYDPEQKTKVTARGMGRALREAGVDFVNQGRPVMGPSGRIDRYYCIRNEDKWLKANHKELADHLASRGAAGKKGKRY